MDESLIPADVPHNARKEFSRNFDEATAKTGRLMLFAADQKIEHMNDDFFGPDIHEDDGNPEHFFRIASKARIGVMATQLGLIARYGKSYPSIPYLVKINSKTGLVKTEQQEPFSNALYDVEQIVEFKKETGLGILGVGYTIYLGSEYEHVMLRQAAQVVREAHKHGLITVLWIYPRGKAVKDEKDPHLIAGATGVGACLGADFVKVNPPKKDGSSDATLLKEATRAAGRTGVVCAGGSSKEGEEFLRDLHDQIHKGGASGNATGRNIHQKPLEQAIRLCNAIYAITVDSSSLEEAIKIYNG